MGWPRKGILIEKRVENGTSDSPALRGWKGDWGSYRTSISFLSKAASFCRDGSSRLSLRICALGQENAAQVETRESSRKGFSNILITLLFPTLFAPKPLSWPHPSFPSLFGFYFWVWGKFSTFLIAALVIVGCNISWDIAQFLFLFFH